MPGKRHHGCVLTDPAALIADFSEAADKAGIESWPCEIRIEMLPAPHERPPLPPDEAAVYVFALSDAAGRSAPCGPGTVLKVGKARANHEEGFRNRHYDLTTNTSALAGSLLSCPILWPWLGISDLDADTVAEWMLANLDRTHFFIPFGHPHVRDALTVYLRGRTSSVFEGLSSTGRPHFMAVPGMWA
jgi:hypothetical protein